MASVFVSKLPPSASKMERVMEQVFWEELALIERDIRNFYDPYQCRVDLLPYLAWEMSVDYWDENWSEQTKRDVIAASNPIHTTKGTRYALDKSIESIRDDGLSVTEWFDDEANLAPGFFRVNLEARNSDIDENTVPQIYTAVNNAKNTRSHLESISITSQIQNPINIGVLSRMGLAIRSGPWRTENIVSSVNVEHVSFVRLGMIIRSGALPLELE
ncbi:MULTISPECIES: phage tail protein I [Vibrio]|uniref:Phage tail protein I n=1 Tax=Vibrio plantisponsor TaxID=664643 RepID=A0ABU4IK38_9VIBR|nr:MULTISPECIES: phage tail protein I [Vibrio]EJL6714174.1 phage tail protein I [Vibrio cholerae]EKO3963157.1 phage tail protein I [Vibrio fluvialis]MCZ4371415.1 phage tail protein I [Vibrio diazotrophicus]MDW6017639.1 phage tail protein I [Vibrio plantisponsor]NNM40473.1 phage tail protein I [Vibrio plantisponsor]